MQADPEGGGEDGWKIEARRFDIHFSRVQIERPFDLHFSHRSERARGGDEVAIRNPHARKIREGLAGRIVLREPARRGAGESTQKFSPRPPRCAPKK